MVHPIDAAAPAPASTAAPVAQILAGVRVVVVEDDYYLAMEAKAALEVAGAQILGPFRNFDQICQALADHGADCAVVDINLGEGPSYAAAQYFEAMSLPFLFLTGYSAEAVPADFQHVTRMQKPVVAEALAQAVQRLCS